MGQAPQEVGRTATLVEAERYGKEALSEAVESAVLGASTSHQQAESVSPLWWWVLRLLGLLQGASRSFW